MQEQNRYKWTPEMENKLVELNSLGNISDKEIGKQLGGLTERQIYEKKRRLLSVDGKIAERRRYFSLEEDIILVRCCAIYRKINGDVRWNEVIKYLPGRSKRQCRDRWLNYLSPDLNKKPWTKEENEIILEAVEKYGPNDKTYSLLRKQLNRSLNSIRNHYSKSLKRTLNPNDINTLGQQLNENRLLTQELKIVTADIDTVSNKQKQNNQSQSNSKIILPPISEIFDQVSVYNTNKSPHLL